MRFDAQLVKERVSLKELFERDGHELRRSGPDDLVCRCPFHEEKTASCHVHEDQKFFKCFGCDFGGDCFKYWERSRGVEFGEAIVALAGLAGLNGESVAPAFRAPAWHSTRKEEILPGPMEGVQLEAWMKALERLRDAEDRQAALAKWRGYDVATVRWANEHGFLGLIPYLGEWREAFLVERPSPHAVGVAVGDPVPVGYHIRLGPETAGNPEGKASWRYVPSGIGAWPFVIGDIAKAKVLFFLEGQWDALALIDAMGWNLSGGVESRHTRTGENPIVDRSVGSATRDSGSSAPPAQNFQQKGGDVKCAAPVMTRGEEASNPSAHSIQQHSNAASTFEPEGAAALPKNVAIVGMRGATSWKKFIEHYTWSSEAVAFALADADEAGKGWFAEGGFLEALRERCKQVFGFWPSSTVLAASGPVIKDFNDLWKDRLITREALAGLFRDKMRHKVRGRRPRGSTFLQFCQQQRERKDAVGQAARIICNDKMYRPVGRKPLPVWERYMRSHVPEDQHPGVRAAWREWLRAGVADGKNRKAVVGYFENELRLI
jgi:CHC2 zinc finger